MSGPAYRPDIDGLRTLAVLPVIVFHAGASWLPGGFVGVDIFFVISGYLITSIILREVKQNTFTFRSFYERRARRILPALFAMLLVTLLVFHIIALPIQAENASKAAIAAVLSVSNIYFWQESGYFSATAEFLPLLHTWSLAVEEQFYFAFPIFLLILLRFRLPLLPVVLIGTLLAFAVGFWLSFDKPSAAYYLLPARAWELALGALIALRALPQFNGTFLKEFLPVLGFVMVVLSFFWIQSDMVFPGWVALIPCLGAALIIHSDGRSWFARYFLASRLMVSLGLMSYSLYLWHWPVLTSFRVRTANVHLDMHNTAWALLLTFILAWISWRFVEQPFRSPRTIETRKALVLLGCGSIIVVSFAFASVFSSGFPNRIDEATRLTLTATIDVDPLRTACTGVSDSYECKFGTNNSNATYAIIGDSHAAALRPAIEASGIMGDATGTLFWVGACPFLSGAVIRNHPEQATCNRFREEVWMRLQNDSDIHTVILSGRWPYQLTGYLPESGGSYRAFLIDQDTVVPSPEESAAVFHRSLARSLDRLAEMNKNVIIIGSVPEPGFDVPLTVAMARHADIVAPRGIQRKEVEDRAGFADLTLAEIVNGRDNVRLLSIWSDFCDSEWCAIEHEGLPIYHDDDHLSFRGARLVAAPAIRNQKLSLMHDYQ